MSPSSKKSLRYHWIAGGIASSLSRFIPLPLVDGIIDERAKRYSLDRTLEFHDRRFRASDVEPLYKDNSSASGWIANKAKQLALYPVRRVAKIVTASTGVPKDFARTYLLARAVDSCLEGDLLQDSTNATMRLKEAQTIREAFDSAFERLDDMLFETITGTVRRAFSQMGPEVKAALAKIVGKPLRAKDSSAKAVRNRKDSKTSAANPEDDADFASLLKKFDKLFRKEMADRDLETFE